MKIYKYSSIPAKTGIFAGMYDFNLLPVVNIYSDIEPITKIRLYGLKIAWLFFSISFESNDPSEF